MRIGEQLTIGLPLQSIYSYSPLQPIRHFQPEKNEPFKVLELLWTIYFWLLLGKFREIHFLLKGEILQNCSSFTGFSPQNLDFLELPPPPCIILAE